MGRGEKPIKAFLTALRRCLQLLLYVFRLSETKGSFDIQKIRASRSDNWKLALELAPQILQLKFLERFLSFLYGGFTIAANYDALIAILYERCTGMFGLAYFKMVASNAEYKMIFIY